MRHLVCYHKIIMERIANKSLSFADARKRDIQHQINLSPRERLLIARELKDRVYGRDAKDTRQCHRKK